MRKTAKIGAATQTPSQPRTSNSGIAVQSLLDILHLFHYQLLLTEKKDDRMNYAKAYFMRGNIEIAIYACTLLLFDRYEVGCVWQRGGVEVLWRLVGLIYTIKAIVPALSHVGI